MHICNKKIQCLQCTIENNIVCQYADTRYYLTNMDRRLWGVVSAAIESSGRDDIHIDPWPMPATSSGYTEFVRDCMTDRYFSIYVEESVDCSDFWREYERLKKTDYWRTFLNLSYDDHE